MKIGIFDSGLGGLTALKEAITLMPQCDFVYFGDTGRVPYGTRSAETIKKYARGAVNFLLSHGVDAMLAACGTVSSVALDEISPEYDIPIVGVVDPAAADALKATKNGRIAVIGTSATVNSGTFARKLHDACDKVEVICVPCPLFVPLVENGFIGRGEKITEMVAERYLAPVREFGADTVILACTHYPIISDIIEAVLPGVQQISSGRSAADALAASLPDHSGSGSVNYYVSDSPETFETVASIFMGKKICCSAEKVEIENY